jgi:hypothetical protein
VAGKSDFTADEWMTMRKAMMGAAVFVSVSDGGKADMISEMRAVSDHLMEAQGGHPCQLVRELSRFRHFQSGIRLGMSVREVEAEVLGAMREATAMVGARAPEDLEAFREFLIELAETAANAHREGSFMGFGGSKVSAAEAAAIEKVKQALTPA